MLIVVGALIIIVIGLLKKYSQENTEMESPLALALKAMMAEDK